ncbi:MAG TPA: Sec-independent protein translocase subunit TatA [Mycobacteriales bacterium]|jgi:sec-independent protein translocase protein TatA|nr:Sec-independent protein translocase subunit TatA [Mycobacteriales bacterium]
MNLPQGWELILILLVLVLLFGSKKLPDMARSLGRSARILKAETKGLREDESKPSALPAGTTAESDADREAREFQEFQQWKAAQRTTKTDQR